MVTISSGHSEDKVGDNLCQVTNSAPGSPNICDGSPPFPRGIIQNKHKIYTKFNIFRCWVLCTETTYFWVQKDIMNLENLVEKYRHRPLATGLSGSGKSFDLTIFMKNRSIKRCLSLQKYRTMCIIGIIWMLTATLSSISYIPSPSCLLSWASLRFSDPPQCLCAY